MSKQFSLCICRSYNMSRIATCRIAHKSVLKIYKTWELPPRFALLATNKAMPWTHWGPKGGPRPPAFWAPFENSLIRQYLLWLSLYSIIILLNVKVHQLPSADLIWMKSCWFFYKPTYKYKYTHKYALGLELFEKQNHQIMQFVLMYNIFTVTGLWGVFEFLFFTYDATYVNKIIDRNVSCYRYRYLSLIWNTLKQLKIWFENNSVNTF